MRPTTLLRRLLELPFHWLMFPVLAACTWIVLGMLAQRGLEVAWRNAQLDQFRQSMQVASELAAIGRWQEPWESDPRWQQLEQRLSIDLVPLQSTDDERDKRVPGSQRDSSSQSAQRVQWVQSPQGAWRASLMVMIPDHSGLAIRGTKQFDAQELYKIWWIWWLAGGLGLWLVQLSWQSVSRALSRRNAAIVLTSGSRELPQSMNDADASGVDGNGSGMAWRDRLRITLDSLREGVLMVDGDGRIVLANSALYQQLDLPKDKMEGRLLVEAVRIPRVVELLEHVLRTGQNGQQRFEVSNGKRTLAITATPHQQEPRDSELSGGALLTALDISSTQQSELARREFIAGASHELKTPLAAIRAYTETLQEIGTDDPAASQKFLGNILEQADRMNRLVSSMMQLARAESGEMKLKLERIDAAAAIVPSIEAAVGIAQPKGQTVHVKLPESQLLVLADRDALQTIASNLLSNAIRYTPAGGRIEVSLTLEAPDAGVGVVSKAPMAACLRVIDTGIGISVADQSRIFERFYRVQKDRALDSGGTGLGLAIVKQLTEVLSGSVTVTSRPGEGTRFEIWLPAVGFTQSS